jgi:hypothetical protein
MIHPFTLDVKYIDIDAIIPINNKKYIIGTYPFVPIDLAIKYNEKRKNKDPFEFNFEIKYDIYALGMLFYYLFSNNNYLYKTLHIDFED